MSGQNSQSASQAYQQGQEEQRDTNRDPREQPHLNITEAEHEDVSLSTGKKIQPIEAAPRQKSSPERKHAQVRLWSLVYHSGTCWIAESHTFFTGYKCPGFFL
uniref:Uncharacterized protein n=1 Tax=Thermosporothrix sp. COM3 TaxID=2490863 RepID=A0A455SLN1_9CHLR|nr:hypothetical protein KTC_18460 [Thermosporothrix sp. COM3]